MLLAPMLLPGEIDRGYLGCVMRLNGAVKESEIVLMMAQWDGVSDKSRREVSCLELLSKIAQTEISTFVKQHTTLPLRRGITSYFPDLQHGSEENRNMLWSTAMRVARPGAYYCIECVKQDQASHGISYWHRAHQVPGLLWCPEHKVPLLYMESEQAYLEAPEQILNKSRSVSESWVRNTLDNPFINAFLAISSALLVRDEPFSVKHVSAILRDRAAARGFQTHAGRVNAPLLSDAIVAEFGREWLATVLPTLADKRKGEMLIQMDGVLFMATASSSVAAYMLALSLLFGTPEDALNALIRSDAAVPSKHPCKASRTIENEKLRSAYLKSHGSYSKTANALATSYAAVCDRLRGMGLPNLNGASWPGLEKAAVAFFVEGKSLADSATVGNVTYDALESLVRSTGATIIGVFQEMKKPKSGRGSGARRPRQLSPHEVNSATGRMAVKFSHRLRREQRYILQTTEKESQLTASQKTSPICHSQII